MSDRARHLLHIEHLTRGVLNSPCGHDEIYGGNNNRALRDKKASSLNAIVDSDISAARAFGLSDVCDEVFGNVDALQQFQFGHARPPAVAISDHAIVEPYVIKNRFRAASCLESKQDAARRAGQSHLAALGHAPGAQCNLIPSSGADRTAYASLLARRRAKKCRALYLNPRRNQSAKKYSAISMIAPPMIHHIGSLDFGGSYE